MLIKYCFPIYYNTGLSIDRMRRARIHAMISGQVHKTNQTLEKLDEHMIAVSYPEYKNGINKNLGTSILFFSEAESSLLELQNAIKPACNEDQLITVGKIAVVDHEKIDSFVRFKRYNLKVKNLDFLQKNPQFCKDDLERDAVSVTMKTPFVSLSSVTNENKFSLYVVKEIANGFDINMDVMVNSYGLIKNNIGAIPVMK